MEMLVIAVIAIIAFTAVLVPLFRRRPGAGDAREFENTAQVEGPNAGGAAGNRPDMPSPASTVPADTAGEPAAAAAGAADELELEVQRYRAAVRAGTVCRKCGQANPAESMFCFDCGERLPRDDAKEFE